MHSRAPPGTVSLDVQLSKLYSVGTLCNGRRKVFDLQDDQAQRALKLLQSTRDDETVNLRIGDFRRTMLLALTGQVRSYQQAFVEVETMIVNMKIVQQDDAK